MKIHELAKYFPILEGEEFDLLVQDIQDHGQLEPIVTVGDEILDGVNRYRACEQLGIESLTEEYRGDDPLAYVVSLNIRRRHLTESQRAALATEMLKEFVKDAARRSERGNDGRFGTGAPTDAQDDNLEHDSGGRAKASYQAAKYFGVGGRTIERAKRIKEESPDRFEDVVKGKATVSQVDSELRQARYQERLKEKGADQVQERAIAPIEVQQYINKLMRVMNLLPAEPPREGWSDMLLSEARGYAKIITNRLRRLLENESREEDQ